MFKIKIGPAGTGGINEKGLKLIASYGLDAAEVEFTYGIWMKNKDAKKFGELSKKLGIILSVHAPYYINLASKEKQKIEASKKRILQSCERANYLNAKYVVFHPGFYQGRDKQEVYEIIKKGIDKILSEIKKRKWKVFLAPEKKKKPSQFGSLDETLKLSKETKCRFCIDFAHLKARNNGIINYDKVFKKLKATKINHIHCHFSGIEFNEKGEKRHLLTKEKDIKELLSYMKKYKINATIINESPSPLEDSIKTKKILETLKK